MSNIIGQKAPDFTVEAVMGDNTIKKDFRLSDYKEKYIVLFFFPLAFTFVCPTEIIAFNKRLEAFEKLDAVVLGVSIDSVHTLKAWKNLSVSEGGIGEIKFPLLSDLNKDLARSYEVLHANGVAYRATFIIDKNGLIPHMHVNDLPIGRDVDYILNIIEAIQHAAEYGEVCPAGWRKGTAGMKATTEGVKSYLRENIEQL